MSKVGQYFADETYFQGKILYLSLNTLFSSLPCYRMVYKYCMDNNSCPILLSDSKCKNRQDFLDIQYIDMKSYTATGSFSLQLLNPALYIRQELKVTLHSRYRHHTIYCMSQQCSHIQAHFIWENVGKCAICAVQTYRCFQN